MATKIRPENEKEVIEFLDGLVDSLYISDFVKIDQINEAIEDEEDIAEYIRNIIDENNGFDCEVIYYSVAMEYLTENDTSLRESIELAIELGYEINSVNSELLASIHKSNKVRTSFEEAMNEINEYFESYE